MELAFRVATDADVQTLAELNTQLIRDEGHRSSMSTLELADRMESWLAGDYEAVLFDADGTTVGYALFRYEPSWVYLRQFLVVRSQRRNGIGRAAVRWLITNPWRSAQRIRLDVLVGNASGVAFWRAIGFDDYCTTMELETDN